MSHTKGPWEVFDDDKGEPVVHVRHDVDIAMCFHITGDEHKANARLIAAAPDLLAAVKCLEADLMGAAEEFYGDDIPRCWLLSLKEAKTAIAKAIK